MNSKLWNLFRRKRLERDIAEELAAHAALLEDANRANGTHRRLGSDLALRERTRAADVPVWLDELLRDIVFAARSLWRSRGFALTAVLTLALGIGATTAMFSVVNTVLLHPLPYPAPARLVMVGYSGQGSSAPGESVPRAVIPPLARCPAFAATGWTAVDFKSVAYVHGIATPSWVYRASRSLFAVLGVKPELGRLFSGGGHELLVSDQFWRRYLGSSRAVLGKSIQVGSEFYTLMGVIPAGQGFPLDRGVWISGPPPQRVQAFFVARLPRDVSSARHRAAAALGLIGRRFITEHADWKGIHLAVEPLHVVQAQPAARTELWTLFAAVLCLLLIACSNTADLLLARGLRRDRELTLRRALGASRLRLTRLLLAEGLCLALAGGIAGAGMAWVLIRLAHLGPAEIPRLRAVALDPTALGFAAAVALLSGLGAALAPAWRLSRVNCAATRSQRRLHGLVASEVALTLVLLTGSLLLLRSFDRLQQVKLGFNPTHVTALDVAVPPEMNKRFDLAMSARRSHAFQTLLSRVRTLPGVEAATYSDHVPFARIDLSSIRLPGQPEASSRESHLNYIGPGYLTAMGVPLLAGHAFTKDDFDPTPKEPNAVLVNRALAAMFWPGQNPASVLGKKLQWGSGEQTVAGVVANVRDASELSAKPLPEFYEPYQGNRVSVEFLIRTKPGIPLAAEVSAATGRVLLGMSIGEPMTLANSMQAALAQPRFRTLLLGIFAALAWGLALVGIYGALAYQVRQRRREIAVRMAIGAQPHAILRLVLQQCLSVVAAGIGAGWLLSWYLAHFLRTLLYGVGAFDPLSWLGAGAAVLLASLLASFIPTRRALRVDAGETLRCE